MGFCERGFWRRTTGIAAFGVRDLTRYSSDRKEGRLAGMLAAHTPKVCLFIYFCLFILLKQLYGHSHLFKIEYSANLLLGFVSICSRPKSSLPRETLFFMRIPSPRLAMSTVQLSIIWPCQHVLPWTSVAWGTWISRKKKKRSESW